FQTADPSGPTVRNPRGGPDRDVISDEGWAFIEPLLPSSKGRRGGRWRDHRQVVEGIAWRYRTGSPWRDLPKRFGPWQTVWKRHNRWTADGTWQRLVTAAQARADASGELDWLVAVDSTLVPAHQHAAGARRGAGDTGGFGESHVSARRAG
ncbi:MAG: IS5 family transposase, partial [Actinobacteria bacterium]|nr:IS5 family transposase [Actinomycetota bacterium]